MIVLKVIAVVILVVILVIIFACMLADKMQNERMKSLNNTIAFLKDCRKADAKDYRAMRERVLQANTKLEELKKENEELKKQLDKQGNVTYNYYINK